MLAAILRCDRAVTLLGLALLAGLAWIHLVRLGAEMADMAGMGMAHTEPWTAADAALAAAMWGAMMVAMMVPTAAPMVLTFVAVNERSRAAGGRAAVSTPLFVLGYLVVWGGFSVAAAGLQWGLNAAALLSEDAMRAVPWLGAAILIAAGLYQLTPLKYACLSRCRTPLAFLMGEWRSGGRGALIMGLRHGLFCLGCCWVLMGLLFVGGVMNLAWVAAITLFVLIEKIVPGGRLLSWAAGLALLGWGTLALWTAWAGA